MESFAQVSLAPAAFSTREPATPKQSFAQGNMAQNVVGFCFIFVFFYPTSGLPLAPNGAKLWDGAALSWFSQTQPLPTRSTPGFRAAPRRPAEPSIPAALGKLDLVSPAQRQPRSLLASRLG